MDPATGKIVALEGDTQSISVQLSLLPSSKKILVLPPLSQVPSSDTSDNFDARKYIRDVHTIFNERMQTANGFLQSSTSAHRRLVFLNGGSIGARAACIEKISENLTNGELEAAEAMFNDLVKDGVAGLVEGIVSVEEEESSSAAAPTADIDGKDDNRRASNIVTEAGLLTTHSEAFVPSRIGVSAPQAPNREAGDKVGSFFEQRSSSDPGTLPIAMTDSIKEPPKIPTSIFTTREGDLIVHTVLEYPVRSRHVPIKDPLVVYEKRSTFGPRDSSHTPNTQYHNALSHQSEESEEEEGPEYVDTTSPLGDIISTPATPAVVFGEACLVDMQSASPSVKRARSFHRFFPSPAMSQGSFLSPRPLKHTTSAYSLRKKSSTSSGGSKQKRYSKFPTTPRSTFVKASQTTIRRSPTLNGSMRTDSNSSNEHPKLPLSDQFAKQNANSGELIHAKIAIFEPVLPATEDIIIHIVDENPREIIYLVIQSFQSGKYTNSRSSLSPAAFPDSPTSEYSSPDPQYLHGQHALRPSSYQSMVTGDNHTDTTHGTSANTNNNSFSIGDTKSWPAHLERPLSTVSYLEPPTPIPTPPNISFIADKIFDLAPPLSPSTVLGVHNTLRQFLSVHLPSGGGFSQHYYPVASEAERLWKPVFGNDECSSIGEGGKTVDQIIALGCEPGVNKEYFYQLSGQVERLGTKKDGLNRSGKLDIRYLIGTAMQAQEMPPTFDESDSNPLTDPDTLAALLVPHLESFLATNPNTRLLILQYQASHLAVVLALQRILGRSIIKIAAILDSLASDPPSFASSRRPGTPLSPNAVAERWRDNAHHSKSSILHHSIDRTVEVQKNNVIQRSSKSSAVSFSRANYLLSSTATDAEITYFLSSIWKCLMEKSPFYTPEVEFRPSRFNQSTPPTPTSATRFSPDHHPQREHPPRDSSMANMPRPSASKTARLAGSTAGAGSSDARSVRSTRSAIPSTVRSPSPVQSSRSVQPQSHPQPQVTQRPRAKSQSARSFPLAKYPSPNSGNNTFIAPPVPKIMPPVRSEKRTAREPDRGDVTEKTVRAERIQERVQEKTEKTWDNFYIGEDDSDDDEMDRKMMGREMARIVPEARKVSLDSVQNAPPPRNKKKALKWLGLA